ncbi:MAG TPA: hypothetical protein VIU38_07675 [Anaerolineales bacterium]
MNIARAILFVNASLIVVLLAACSALPSATVPQVAPSAQVQPSTGVQYHFVTNQLLLPATQAQADAYALNVDGDAGQSKENLFGKLLTLLTSAAPGLELQGTLDQAVKDGKLVSLHVVKADDPLNDPSVSWSIVQGQETQAPPVFDGSDEFKIDAAAPLNEPMVGTFTAGHFSGGPGASRLRIFLFGQAVDLDFIGLRLEADVSANGCANGKLGGGVTVDEFRGKLLPVVADGLNQVAKADPTAANILMTAFDSDRDGSITVPELEKNPMLMLAISPDLDLLDSAGKFNPGQDGTKDSYSVAMGFTCVPANFTAPGD